MNEMENMNDLRLSRIQNFKNIITGQGNVDHIPHFGNFWSWKYYDAGYKFSEALNDYGKMEKAILEFVDRYKMDSIYETGWRNPIQVTGILGNSNDYIINDETFSISIKDQSYMDDDDYEALAANPKKYLWETFLPKKFPLLKNDPNSEEFQTFLNKYLEFGGVLGKIGGEIAGRGMATLADPNGPADYWGFGYELLFCIMRGMKKLSIDLRRRSDAVDAACQALDETFAIPRLERGLAGPDGSNPEFLVDMNPVLLAHVILSQKQFERFYMPQINRVNRAVTEKDKLVYLFVEGSFERFWDYFRDLPEGHYAYHVELDDIFRSKEALPNMVMAGGMPSNLLGSGTPEECVDYAKKLIDEIGGNDHRFIFSEVKMVSFPKDCNRENLIAICDYLNSIHY